MTATAVVPATDPRTPEHLRGYPPESYENCKGVLVPAGVCGTEHCSNKRWSTDTTGFCKPCKVAKGIIPGKRALTAPVRQLSPNDPAWRSAQEALAEQKAATLDDDLVLRIWNALPNETRLRIVNDAFPEMPRLVRLSLLRAVGVGAA